GRCAECWQRGRALCAASVGSDSGAAAVGWPPRRGRQRSGVRSCGGDGGVGQAWVRGAAGALPVRGGGGRQGPGGRQLVPAERQQQRRRWCLRRWCLPPPTALDARVGRTCPQPAALLLLARGLLRNRVATRRSSREPTASWRSSLRAVCWGQARR